MIHTSRTVTVGKTESIINEPIVLYRGDREVEVEFAIVGSKFTFTNGGNVIQSTNATHGQLVVDTPTGENMFSEVTECHEGKVVFTITKEMIDELAEVGLYSFQIRLFDESQVSRVTIPPVYQGIEIRHPMAAEDETDLVDIGLVDYSVVRKNDYENVATFLPNGDYNKTNWEEHDVISRDRLNKVEDALYEINKGMEGLYPTFQNQYDEFSAKVDKDVKAYKEEMEDEVEQFERNINTGVEVFKIDTNAAMTAYKNAVSEDVKAYKEEIEDEVEQFERDMTQAFGEFKVDYRDDMYDRMDVVEGELEEFEKRINFTKIFLKSEDNTPTKLNELIDIISGKENSSIDFFNYCGVIELGVGIFEVDEVIMRSNVTIKGQGIGKTIIKPIAKNEDDFLFKCIGTDSANRLVNFELRDLSIMSNPEGQYALPSYANRFLRAGIDFSYTSSCRVENVIISGLKGTAIKCVEHYDSDFTKIQILACGDDDRAGFQITVGTDDGCNAFRINNFRFEQLSKVLVNDDNYKFLREIHFLGGKFEGTQLHLESVTNVNITNTHFTWGNNDTPLIYLSKKQNAAEIYGIKFVACTFLTANNNDAYGVYNNAQMTYFNSCTFKGFGKAIRGNNFTISNCDFYDCLTPIIDVGNSNTIIGNWFRGNRGTEKVGLFNSYNTLAFNNSTSRTDIDQFYIKGTENDIIWNGVNLPSTGPTNWHASNNIQLNNSLKVPHNTNAGIGKLKYDVNTKILYIYNGSTWDRVLNKQCEYQVPCNTTNISDIQAVLNGLIAKLVSSGVMKGN